MRTLIILSYFLAVSLIAAGQDVKEISLCDRLKNDQSNLPDWDSLSKQENNLRILTRQVYFRENFSFLLNSIRKNKLVELKSEKCYTRLFGMTLIHIAEVEPDLLLKKDVLDLLIAEIEKGNLQRDLLRGAIFMGKGRKGFLCNKNKAIIEYAIEKSKINEIDVNPVFGKIENLEYEDCPGMGEY